MLTLSLSCQDDGSRKPDMKLAVPDILKVQLVDDWEAVTKNGQVRLPQNSHSVYGKLLNY